MSEDDVERCLAAAAAAHASYRLTSFDEGRVGAQPGHACHRRPVFADRADVHVTHVPGLVGVPKTLIASHWLPPGDGRTHGQMTKTRPP